MKMLQLAVALGCSVAWAAAPSGGLPKKPMTKIAPKAAAAKGSANQCQRYLDHLIVLHAAAFMEADPEAKKLTGAKRDEAIALVKAEAAKQPEIQAELKDCKTGAITAAEIECTLKADSSKVAERCAGL